MPHNRVRVAAHVTSAGLLPAYNRKPAKGNGRVMARIVMKFGGTSVGDIARIRNVAAHVARV